jgi:salicylate hydroxylase
MAPSNDLHFAIIGGGITGLTLAIALHYRGLSVKLYEQAPSFKEIGAGVAFTPNAVEAMRVCHAGVYEAFESVRTRNLWESKQDTWFDYYDGVNAKGDQAKQQRPAFSIKNQIGNAGVHRAKFLDQMVELLPQGIAKFGKRLESIDQIGNGLMQMAFTDGTTATADAILGCDGIKSRVRQIMFGENHPCAHPTYTHKYAYRALVPMEDAISAMGEEKAMNSCMHVSMPSILRKPSKRLILLDGP